MNQILTADKQTWLTNHKTNKPPKIQKQKQKAAHHCFGVQANFGAGLF